MFNIFKSTVEYQGWGWNALTVGTIGALILLIVESWGMVKQIQKMWADQSAGVLSVHWFGYIAGFMLACVPYGVTIKSGTIVLAASTLFVLHVPVLWGIYTFRGYTRNEALGLIAYALMLPVMIWLPWINTLYLAFSIGTVWAVATQPWEMWRKQSRGEVEIRLVLALLISVTFWSIYAFAVNALALMIMNPLLGVLLVITLVLWLRYPKEARVASQVS